MADISWPREEYRLAPNDYLAALGQLTFIYNMLESMMRNIFEQCAPLQQDFAAALFHKLNNRERIDLLTAFVNQNENDPAVRSAVLSCINHYEICTENRNILMHSIYFNPSHKGLEMAFLVKRAANDPRREVHYDVPLPDLQKMADETVETFRFALNLYGFLGRRDWIRKHPAPPKRLPNALPDTPPKPHRLTPYQPPIAPKGAPSPPQSSV
jgi:hypothetical protein